ncbi:MAG: hypothetical protein COX48_00080 [bacterium (Candidatus Stahlbacteria) CG23_combo_of_CG06-09_8_20_14_all_34_7]|nr:MAG: hypothetical protein COX48_00080 [bacterium (Candidatus Stahlbacteria) CG23_combo_of_CG06-09_8_20_14_all_34_7]
MSSSEIDLELKSIYETKSLEMADIILLYGCINRKFIENIIRELNSTEKEIKIIKIGKCIISNCNDLENAFSVKQKIILNLDGCPPSVESVENALINILYTERNINGK